MAINLQGNNTSTYSDDVTISGDLSAAAGMFGSNSVTIGTFTGYAKFARAEGNVYINSSSSGLLQITDPADNPNITLNADGSAGFENGAEFISNTSGKPCVYARDKSSGGARLWEGRNSGGAATSWINPDGGAIFGSGNITLNANGDAIIGQNLQLRYLNGNVIGGTMLYDPNAAGAVGAVAVRTFGNNGTGGGGVELVRNTTSWGAYSQRSLKTDFVPIASGLDKVSTLSAVTGRYKTDEVGTSRSFLIADEVQQVLPEAVSGTGSEEDPLSLRYTEVIPLLVSALHDAKDRIEALEAQLSQLTTTGGASS